jgi:hypothetical protein
MPQVLASLERRLLFGKSCSMHLRYSTQTIEGNRRTSLQAALSLPLLERSHRWLAMLAVRPVSYVVCALLSLP